MLICAHNLEVSVHGLKKKRSPPHLMLREQSRDGITCSFNTSLQAGSSDREFPLSPKEVIITFQ